MSKKIFKEIVMPIWVTIILCLMTSSAYANDSDFHHQDKIIVSNIPLAGIVQMITGDAFEIESIDTQNSCPHHYHAKPSDLLKLKNSKIAIYIDDGFESFFKNMLKRFDGEVLKITDLISIDSNITKHSHEHDKPNDHTHHDHTHTHHHEHGHTHHDHDHTDTHTHAHNDDLNNYHIWVDLNLVADILPEIKDYFTFRYPEFSEVFEKNYQISITRIESLKKQKQKALDKMPKLVLLNHNADLFFASGALDENKIISLPVSDYPSLQLINKLDDYMSKQGDICIITEFGNSKASYDQISPLQRKYNKPVIELNTEKWTYDGDINYVDNFFNQYEELITEVLKCRP